MVDVDNVGFIEKSEYGIAVFEGYKGRNSRSS